MGRPNKLLLALINDLRRQIELCHSPGEPIASQRELAQMHGTTHSTVRRALHELRREKLVRPVSRVGWIRAQNGKRSEKIPARVSKHLRLGIISRRRREAWEKSELLGALLKGAADRGMEIVEVPNRRLSTTTRNRARIELTQVPWNTFDVALLAEIEEPLTLSDPLLRKHRVLSVDQDSTPFGVDSVAFANWDAGVMAARHLYDLGHRRFSVTEEVNDEGWVYDPSWTARRQGFEFMLSWLGGVIRPEWRLPVKRAGWHKEPAIRKAIASWSAKPLKDRPTAVYGIEAASLSELIPACAEFQIRIPKDLSVMTTSWNPATTLRGGLQITHVSMDLKGMIDRTFETAARIAAEESYFDFPRRKPFCVTIPGKLIPGSSTRFLSR